jgi:putative nucleotidyltransferase with HDIG domain
MVGRQKFELLLCDPWSPTAGGTGGAELAQRAVAVDPDLAVVMLGRGGGVGDSAAEASPPAGGSAYLWSYAHPDLLAQALGGVLYRRAPMSEPGLGERRGEWAASVAPEVVAQRAAQLEREREALRSVMVNVAEMLVTAMEAKDVYLRGHSLRVAALAASVAEELGLDADTVEAVRLAGHLHDVGKIGTREAVLNKPGELTPEEFDHIKDHVRIGLEILSPLKHLGVVLDYVGDHHEHFDGGGYPHHRQGEEISIGGRILTTVDAFDALTSTRAYRGAMTAEETLTHLGNGYVGTLLDPHVYDALCAVVRGRRALVFIEPVR